MRTCSFKIHIVTVYTCTEHPVTPRVIYGGCYTSYPVRKRSITRLLVICHPTGVEMAHKGIREGLGVTLPKTSMEGVCGILSQFGLDAEVQERFRAHKLDDLEVVKELTPEELCEIGIVALGDRKKIAKLIDALKNGWIPRPAFRQESRPDTLASVVVRPPVATYAQV